MIRAQDWIVPGVEKLKNGAIIVNNAEVEFFLGEHKTGLTRLIY